MCYEWRAKRGTQLLRTNPLNAPAKRRLLRSENDFPPRSDAPSKRICLEAASHNDLVSKNICRKPPQHLPNSGSPGWKPHTNGPPAWTPKVQVGFLPPNYAFPADVPSNQFATMGASPCPPCPLKTRPCQARQWWSLGVRTLSCSFSSFSA